MAIRFLLAVFLICLFQYVHQVSSTKCQVFNTFDNFTGGCNDSYCFGIYNYTNMAPMFGACSNLPVIQNLPVGGCYKMDEFYLCQCNSDGCNAAMTCDPSPNLNNITCADTHSGSASTCTGTYCYGDNFNTTTGNFRCDTGVGPVNEDLWINLASMNNNNNTYCELRSGYRFHRRRFILEDKVSSCFCQTPSCNTMTLLTSSQSTIQTLLKNQNGGVNCWVGNYDPTNSNYTNILVEQAMYCSSFTVYNQTTKPPTIIDQGFATVSTTTPGFYDSMLGSRTEDGVSIKFVTTLCNTNYCNAINSTAYTTAAPVPGSSSTTALSGQSSTTTHSAAAKNGVINLLGFLLSGILLLVLH